jgi:hypothetical protein
MTRSITATALLLLKKQQHVATREQAFTHLYVCFILVAAAAVVVYLRPGVACACGATTQPAEGLRKTAAVS